MSDSDLQLLERYTRQHAEDAFSEIVRRHLDLVFSAALRQVRSPQLAEEVAQSAFTDLARQAHHLAPDTVLSAWLYQVTRRTAIDVVRRESRRQAREQVACELNAMNTAAADWTHIEPLLDEAMQGLEDVDRTAVLLRYFENQSLREVGQRLGTTEEAARKRVSRAVERLREVFVRRGVTVGASGLVALVSANAVQAAPAGLAVTISAAAALAGTAIVASTTASTAKAFVMTTLQKTAITGAIALSLGTGVYEARQASRLQDQVQTLQQQQAPLVGQVQLLQNERDAAKRQLAVLREENERLHRDTADLLKLRSEVASLRNESRQMAQGKTGEANDATAAAAQAWLSRVRLLKQRFEQWPGKRTPELQLLNEQDWLNEAAKQELDSDATCRKAMSQLRWTAKNRFASVVKEALEQFAKSSSEQLPSDPAQLKPYLQPPLDSILDGYEIAKPGSVHPPQPNSPNSERAETWALVEKGNFTPDGIPIRDGSNLADPDYDMYVVIYRGGSYGYGMAHPRK
jgi:RNA polymerase sigma factor (sigma-70 family)